MTVKFTSGEEIAFLKKEQCGELDRYAGKSIRKNRA
jgi:hypothetical protein